VCVCVKGPAILHQPEPTPWETLSNLKRMLLVNGGARRQVHDRTQMRFTYERHCVTVGWCTVMGAACRREFLLHFLVGVTVL